MGVCTITYLTTIYSASRAHHQEESGLASRAWLFWGGRGGERYLYESTGFSCYTAHG